MKAMSGMMRSTPGRSSPAKATPRSTISHLRRFGRAVAVERAIHADLAETAERREHELAVVCHLGSAFPRARSRRRIATGEPSDGGNIQRSRGLDRFRPALPDATADGRAGSSPSKIPSRRAAARSRSRIGSPSPAAGSSQCARIAAKPRPAPRARGSRRNADRETLEQSASGPTGRPTRRSDLAVG